MKVSGQEGCVKKMITKTPINAKLVGILMIIMLLAMAFAVISLFK